MESPTLVQIQRVSLLMIVIFGMDAQFHITGLTMNLTVLLGGKTSKIIPHRLGTLSIIWSRIDWFVS